MKAIRVGKTYKLHGHSPHVFCLGLHAFSEELQSSLELGSGSGVGGIGLLLDLLCQLLVLAAGRHMAAILTRHI